MFLIAFGVIALSLNIFRVSFILFINLYLINCTPLYVILC